MIKTLILGLDAFDPVFFEQLYNKGQLPNLGKFVEEKSYSQFQVSNPPQSEVSWTSIASGLNPGEHGMFDFVHRDPKSYGLYVSLLPTQSGVGGIQFVRPHNAQTIFDKTAELGYPSISLWWPATFPARPESPVCTLPGLGTPDIQGRLGVGALYTSNPDHPEKFGKTPVYFLESLNSNHFRSYLEGPQIKGKSGRLNATLDFNLLRDDDTTLSINIGNQILKLTKGTWSPIIELRFKINPLVSIYAITRMIVTHTDPFIQLYFLPLQLHPLHALWRYGTPKSFINDAWNICGPFLTLGWPQDTTGLEDGCISDDQFLELCRSIDASRTTLLMHQLDRFHEGLLASVFDTLDRLEHMFWQNRPDIIQEWYGRLDELVGKVIFKLEARRGEQSRLLIVSDHGFKEFDYKVDLNRWLIEHNYLVPFQDTPSGSIKSVDWSRSKAYAIGLNSIYINLAGREGMGVISDDDYHQICEQLRQELLAWTGSNTESVFKKVMRNNETFTGQLSQYGPDLVIGYAPGYRASADTGLGAWKQEIIDKNNDHWNADHCFDSESVPGVIFSNMGLLNFSNPSYRDFPALAIETSLDIKNMNPPPTLTAEDQEKVEERLRSLGYL